MKLSFLDEPELEFGNGGMHVDVRFGLAEFGPLDVGSATAPTELRLGLVGSQASIDAIQSWLETCKGEIAGKSSRLTKLFPPFPGFSETSPFQSSITFHQRWCSAISQREFDAVLSGDPSSELVSRAVSLFLEHAKDVMQQGGPTVIICAPPAELLAALDEPRTDAAEAIDQEIDESADAKGNQRGPCFHDLLKARGMSLGAPIQMVRPATYSDEPAKPRKTKNKKEKARQLQDPATRAWNLHTALYYKAGGVPWRLIRNSTDLTACFVGVSFYKSLDGSRLLTSVAQVFNELGEGVIVKGAPAQLDKDDRQPHLSEEDAFTLLRDAIQVYRREHKTLPARVVLHKTSKLTVGELTGFERAARDREIDVMDLVSVRRSYTRLYRENSYPPLRGTFLEMSPTAGLLYLRGSVNFFETYPGLYVPRPVEFALQKSSSSPFQIAREMLALSKLNWNNTQFDGGEPITVRASRRVGDILRCCTDGAPIQPGYRFFM